MKPAAAGHNFEPVIVARRKWTGCSGGLPTPRWAVWRGRVSNCSKLLLSEADPALHGWLMYPETCEVEKYQALIARIRELPRSKAEAIGFQKTGRLNRIDKSRSMSIAETAQDGISRDIQFTHAPEGYDALALAQILRDLSQPGKPGAIRACRPR